MRAIVRIRPPSLINLEALDQMVAAWTKNLAEGKETAMLAWRKANVAALNGRARTAMAEAGLPLYFVSVE